MTPPNMKNPVHLLAFGLGSGLAKKAPGTFGTLAALPLWWWWLADVPALPYLGVLISGFAFGVWICDKTSRDMGVHDHGGIVWDEWIGVWITLFALPLAGNIWQDLAWVVYAFALFRFFDIIKPWPIKWLDQKVHGGFGIMIDDVIAGIFALIILQMTAHFL
ncbi:MAG: phosphatidylglycerophosphatase A [Oleibacter sp.]|nr:phosphatidylglycerophosphatase A [Thalassolituus sp.]